MSKSIASLAIASLATVALFAGNAVAQGQSQGQQPSAAGGQGGLDKHIAACMLLGNQEEIALAQFAKERCESDQCKQFATMLIEAHQQAVSKIEEAAPQLAATDFELRNAKLSPDQSAQPQGNSVDPALMLARQVKEECLAMTTKALGEKQGAEFDKAYISQQVFAHRQMKAGLKGSEPFASQQLKPVIQEGMKMTDQHLAKAKELLTQMTGSQPNQQASNPQAQTQQK